MNCNNPSTGEGLFQGMPFSLSLAVCIHRSPVVLIMSSSNFVSGLPLGRYPVGPLHLVAFIVHLPVNYVCFNSYILKKKPKIMRNWYRRIIILRVPIMSFQSFYQDWNQQKVKLFNYSEYWQALTKGCRQQC